MIKRPKPELADFERVLLEVPKEKRRVIILAGRHPNEGSIKISARHHRGWEKLGTGFGGAVVVHIPQEWTPQHFWKHAPTGETDEQRIARSKTIPSDSKIVDFLTERFGVPVVNFHGNPWPIQKSIITGVKPVTTRMDFHLHPDSKLTLPVPWPHVRRDISPNEVLLEYYFETPLGKGGTFKSESQLTAFDKHFPALSDTYLSIPRLSAEALKRFSKYHAEDFKAVLRHLAATGLKK